MFSKKVLLMTALAAALALVATAAIATGLVRPAEKQVFAGSVGAPGASSILQRTAGGRPVIPVAPVLPAAAGAVTFSDTFSRLQRNVPDGWHYLPQAPGSWAAIEDRLEQWGDLDRSTSNDPSILVTNDAIFANGVYDAQVFPMGGEPVGVVFRGSDAGYYRLSLYPYMDNVTSSNSARARLDKIGPNGEVTGLASSKGWAGFVRNQWQRMEVRASGGRTDVSVDGTQLFDVNDASLTSGWVGVWTIADRGSAFDNVRVQRSVAGR